MHQAYRKKEEKKKEKRKERNKTKRKDKTQYDSQALVSRESCRFLVRVLERAAFQEPKGEAEAAARQGWRPIRGLDWGPESPDWGVFGGSWLV